MLKHLACIMDGNRRWAKKHGMFPWEGHKEGVEAAKRAVTFCVNNGIEYLSLYTFSQENLKNRPSKEQYFMFHILPDQIADDLLKHLQKHNVRIRFIGDRSLFPNVILPMIDRFESETKDNTALALNMLFCYGGQQEIIAGVKDIVHKVKSGEITQEQITPELLNKSLWMGEFPAPDMVVRTSGISRISNFLLFQCAYSEFYFIDCLWPEINEQHLQDIVDRFDHVQRNFGK